MNYDHSKKTGNLGDVWKHFILVSIANAIDPVDHFSYCESHSGAPDYNLKAAGEWTKGIGVALQNCESLKCHPYFVVAEDLVRSRRYAAGWWFFAKHLASRVERVQVLLSDSSNAVGARYDDLTSLAPAPTIAIQFEKCDGYDWVRKHSSADLVFLDPPFHPNAATDWRALRETCRELMKANTVFLAWYPIYWHSKPQELVNAVGFESWELQWADFSKKPSQNLKGCGMLASPALTTLKLSAQLDALARCLGARFSVRKSNRIKADRNDF